MQGEQHYAGEEFEASDTDAKAWAGRGLVRILSRITLVETVRMNCSQSKE
jgi:hypothetical protein